MSRFKYITIVLVMVFSTFLLIFSLFKVRELGTYTLDFVEGDIMPVIEVPFMDTTLLFLVDTGASISFIDKSVFDKHRELFDIEVDSFMVQITDLRNTDSLWVYRTHTTTFNSRYKVNVLSGTHLIDHLKIHGCQVSGIIGKDFLINNSVIINYDKKYIRFNKWQN